MPESLREAGGVSHDVGELPIHPESAGACRPMYVGYGDGYSVSSEALVRRYAELERQIREREQYRGIPRIVAARDGDMAHAAPCEVVF